MKQLFATLLFIGQTLGCWADAFVIAPSPSGSLGGPTETGTLYPFLIKWTTLSSAPFLNMRYQQVYNSSLFTNLDPGLIYVTTLQFSFYSTNFVFPWTVPDMQVNLSTTTKSADGLSAVFSENVGTDDTVVFGPGSSYFQGSTGGCVIQFARPFRYNPALGNLLLDIRIINATDPISPMEKQPLLEAFNSPTDEVSRVWATNATATTASGSDTIGITTWIQLSGVPTLHIYTSYFGTPTNFISIEWPTEPMGFVLQRSVNLGTSALWQPVNTSGVFSNQSFQRYYFPVSSAGSRSFYRLFWSGQ